MLPAGPATTIDIFDFMAGGRGSDEVEEEEVEEKLRGRFGLASGGRSSAEGLSAVRQGTRHRSGGEAGEMVGEGAISSSMGRGVAIVSKLLTTLEVKSRDEPERREFTMHIRGILCHHMR